jgi:CzcA family heavy metal efflux pump
VSYASDNHRAAGVAYWAEHHQRSLLFLLVTLIAGGVFFGLRLPVALFPKIAFPRVVVSLDTGDRPAEEMAALVTYPVETALRAVPAVRSVRSATSRGSAQISVNFAWGTDMSTATLQVEAALAQTMPILPAGTLTEVQRMDPTVFPVIAYSLSSPLRSQTTLYDLAYYQLRPLLSTVDGVARVGVLGGAPEEIHVVASPAQLERFGLTVGDVAQALSAANVITAAGVVEDEYKLYLVLTDARPSDLEELSATILRSGKDGFVRLDDVATLSRAAAPQRNIVTADGRRAVLFQVYQQPGGNTVQIAHDIKQMLASASDVLPPDVELANWYDQSDLINASASSVRDAVLLGVLLAMVVLLVFLRNGRITIIAAVVVPAVLTITTLALGALGQTFNLMTLGGMAAAVGLIIDDTIVMMEHIVRRMEERGSAAVHGGLLGAAMEFTRPLVGSSAATIVIFTPLAFLSGVTGAFFRALSLTMATALIVSYLIAWLVVPLLTVRLVREQDARRVEHGLASRVPGLYEHLLSRLLQRPALLLLGIIPLVVLGYVGHRMTGSGFMPATDEGGFILDFKAAPGTSLTETDRLLQQVEAILRGTPEVETYSRRTGLQLGGGLTESNEGDFFIRLIRPPRRPIAEVMDEVRTRVEQDVPGLRIEMAQLMEDLIGDLTAVPQPIEIKLYADNGALLDALAPQVAQRLEQVPGVVDVQDGIVLAGDALRVRIDRDRAALEGVDPDAVAQVLTDLIGGAVTTRMPRGEKMVDVRVWVPEQVRNSIRDVGELLIHAPDGHRFPVRRIAAIERISGQPQITRDDLKRMAAVTGRISGRDLGSTLRDVKAFLAQPGVIPGGVYYRLGGLYEQQQIAFRGLLAVFTSAVLLVFLVLLFLYERFRVALAMLTTTALALAAVYLGLWLTGTEVNIASMMGLTMIVGIVTEVSIFYVTEYRELTAVTDVRQRLVQAGRSRLRPIAMTTLAAILALLPLALGLGHGAGMLQPLAIAIEAGLVAQLPLALLVLPVLLELLRVE